MTISILAYDEKTGTFGGAAATGSLCVGGWVLRGDAESGMSASQGSLPSTIWGTEVLGLMRAGASAEEAVISVTAPDPGRGQRQLACLDLAGGTFCHTGEDSIPACGFVAAPGVIVSGNLLSSMSVLEACLDGFEAATGTFPARLIAALSAARSAGGDSRGFLSAAVLAVSRTAAPLTLRIDHSRTPLEDLAALHDHATSGPYGRWAALVPTQADPHRAEPFLEDYDVAPAAGVTRR